MSIQHILALAPRERAAFAAFIKADGGGTFKDAILRTAFQATQDWGLNLYYDAWHWDGEPSAAELREDSRYRNAHAWLRGQFLRWQEAQRGGPRWAVTNQYGDLVYSRVWADSPPLPCEIRRFASKEAAAAFCGPAGYAGFTMTPEI